MHNSQFFSACATLIVHSDSDVMTVFYGGDDDDGVDDDFIALSFSIDFGNVVLSLSLLLLLLLLTLSSCFKEGALLSVLVSTNTV